MSSTAKKLSVGALARAILALSGAIVGFLMMPYLVSNLGDKWYGIWTATGSVVGGYYLVDFGLSSAVTRFVTESIVRKDTKRTNSIISTAFVIYSALGAFVLVLCLGTAYFAKYFVTPADVSTVRIVIILVGCSIALGFPFKAYAGVIQSFFRYDLLAYWNISLLVVLTGMTYLFVAWGFGILALAEVSVAGTILSDGVFYFLSRRLAPYIRLSRSSVSKETARELFGFSIWAFAIHIADQIRYRIAPIIIAAMQTASAVTHFTIGARLAETAIGFLYTSTNVIQPLLTSYVATGDREKLHYALKFFTKINSLIGVFVLGMLLMLGGPFIGIWMGPDYPESRVVLYLLSGALFIAFVLYPLENSLYAFRRHDFLAKANFIDAIIFCVLAFVLGRAFGITGVAASSLAAMFITRFLIVAPFACASNKIPYLSFVMAIFQPVLAAIAAFVPLLVISRNIDFHWSYWTLFLYVAAGFIVFVPISFAMALNSRDRAHLLGLVKSTGPAS